MKASDYMTSYPVLNQVSAPELVTRHLVYNEAISHTYALENGFLSISNNRLLLCQNGCLTIPLSSIVSISLNDVLVVATMQHQYVFKGDASLLLILEKSICFQLFNKED